MKKEKKPKGFWSKLPHPFFALAPMSDVTDIAFRQIIAKYGKPDVFWTEFVSCDGICSPGRERLLRDLEYSEIERPIVAQIFSSNPDTVLKTAQIIKELGFDGVDINMGCPDRSIEKQGAGASLMKDPKLAVEIIHAAQEGCKNIPVSVKTRIGYSKDEINEWIPTLLETGLDALTIHARTRKELSSVPAKWEYIARVVELARNTDTLIIGNGDVESMEDGHKKARETGADGVMVGRAIFGDPWFFADVTYAKHNCHIAHPPKLLRRSEAPADCTCISINEKLRVLIEHTKLFEKKLGNIKNFAVMKKHFATYVVGFDGAKELRMKLMETHSVKEAEKVITTFLKK